MAGALVTTNILGTTVAMGLKTLREKLALVFIANRNYENEITAAKRFATVNVAVPAAVATRTVAPDVVPPAVTAVTPTSIPVTLSQWKEAPFAMDDKGLQQVDRNVIPMQASEAAKALANGIEDYLWSLTPAFYGFAGSSGVTPFQTDLSAYLDARNVGNKQLMDMDPRFVVLSSDAEAAALGLRAFQDASFRGDTAGITEGVIGRKLGALWVMSQRVPTHTAGTGSGYLVNNGAGYAVGIKTITVDTGTGTLLAGDIISFAGHSNTYTVVSTVGGGTVTSITFEPGLVVAIADNEAITKRASFVENLLIQRDALSYAMAPLQDAVQVPGATLQAVAIDEASGLSLRLEVSRQHRQTQWSYDALYGGTAVRANAAVFIAG
jgi:P22 coat protein - gene protein 5